MRLSKASRIRSAFVLLAVCGPGPFGLLGPFGPFGLLGRQGALRAADSFRRGDVEQTPGDSPLNITDPVQVLGYLFLGHPQDLPCLDAADADDSGSINITDAIYILNYLFLGGTPPAAPFPGCGPDPTPDGLDCASYAFCEGGENRPPSASFTARPSKGQAPLEVSLDASVSSDPDGTIVSWAWDLGNGLTASGVTASATYPEPGVYTVRLTVRDDGGAEASATRTVVATAEPPPLDLTGRAALDYRGKELLVAFGPNTDTMSATTYGRELGLYLTAETPTEVTVEYPAWAEEPAFRETVPVAPESFTRVSLPEAAATGWVAGEVRQNAVRAFSEAEFTAYVANRDGHSSDAALALPVDALNLDYVVMDYDPWFIRGDIGLPPRGVPVSFTVYAAFDDTAVTILPSNHITDWAVWGGEEVGLPIDVRLDRGEGYHVESVFGLAGTTIHADRPVGVASGSSCAKVRREDESCDHLFEVALPTQAWGTSVPVAGMALRPGSIYRIVAARDGTTVRQDGEVVARLDLGEFHQTPALEGGHLFEADGPIAVTQFLTGEYFPGAAFGDPSMLSVIPSSQYGRSCVVTTLGDDQFVLHFLTVIAETETVGTFRLDGAPVDPGEFRPIAGSRFSAAVLPIAEGAHRTTSEGVHWVAVEGYGRFDSYAYPGAAQCAAHGFQDDREPPTSVEVSRSDSSIDIEASDEETGIFSVKLLEGAANLRLAVDPFVPGARAVACRVELADPAFDGRGVVEAIDGAGLFCIQAIALVGAGPRPPAPARVPDLVGTSIESARAAILGAGLSVGAVFEEESGALPAGEVIRQSPAPGAAAAEGSAVDLVASLGPFLRTVPELAGLPEAGALAEIAAAGLVPGKVSREASSLVASGRVIRQAPVSGRGAPEGASVDVVVSTGLLIEDLVLAPSLIHLARAEAEEVIAASHLRVGRVLEARSDKLPFPFGEWQCPGVVGCYSVAEGHLAGQYPPAGTPMARGAAVDIVVVSRPPLALVPSVVGRSMPQGIEALRNVARLRLGEVTGEQSLSPLGRVLRQDPSAGAAVAEGGAVDLVVSLGPAPDPGSSILAVPDLSGMPSEGAQATLRAVGLWLGITYEEPTESVPPGRVIRQFPPSGTSVRRGSNVDIVTSQGMLTPVPDVLGLPFADAEAALRRARLYARREGFRALDAQSHSLPAGRVLAQFPRPGVGVAEGIGVELALSLGPGPGGPETETVPDVRGAYQMDAMFLLGAAGFEPGDIRYVESAVPPIIVVAQLPAPGETAPRGSRVSLAVSMGEPENSPYAALVHVPNVVGMEPEGAEALIRKRGLTLSSIEGHEGWTPPGRVSEQSQPPGALVPAGSAMWLRVCLGQGPLGEVAVPDVLGKTEAAAKAALEAVGLRLGGRELHHRDDVPEGIVFLQGPEAGWMLPVGAWVNLVLSEGPEPEAPPIRMVLPDLVGKEAGYALLVLGRAGLYANPNPVLDESIPPGIVIAQSPEGGTVLEPGAFVSLDVSRGPDRMPPLVSVSLQPEILSLGEAVFMVVQAQDEVGIATVNATVDGAPLALEGDFGYYTALFSPGSAGLKTIVATAVDTSGNAGTASATLIVRDPSDSTPPTAVIASPAEDEELWSPADILGTVSDEYLWRYELLIAPAGSDAFRTLASGSSEVIDGPLGRLDTTLYPNGLYDLRLVAEDLNGWQSVFDLPVAIRGRAKPGEFRVSFVDLEVPLSGIPIVVRRTYSSLDRHRSGDFGFGWTLEVTLGVTWAQNRTPGDGWQVSPSGGGLSTPCDVAGETKTHIVEIRFSEREFYRFAFEVEMYGLPSVVVGGCAGTASFIQVGGVPGASLEILGDDVVIWLQGTDLVTRAGFQFGEPYQPGNLCLTTPAGRQYDFAGSGEGGRMSLVSMTEPNGNSLTFTPDGVFHSSGTSVAVFRDWEGRVCQITDPRGMGLSYSYDGEGDLQSFGDRSGNYTTFSYEDHLLVDIRDPDGYVILANSYDPDGRLERQTDGEGGMLSYDFDLAGNSVTVTDGEEVPIVLVYDERGDVTEATSPSGTTTATYDEAGRKTSETDALGNTRTFAYDAAGRLVSETDPLGNRTSYTYAPGGALASIADPKGNVVAFEYDPRGNPAAISDASGMEVARFEYDASGNLSRLEALGGAWDFEHDASGNVLRRTGPGGAEVSCTYDEAGNKLSETVRRTTPGGPIEETTTYEHDPSGLLLRRTDPLRATTVWQYDAGGRVELMGDPLGRTTSFEYDLRGNLVRKVHFDGTVERFGHDRDGRLTAWTDRAGRTTFHERDAEGRVSRTIFPDGSAVAYAYDAVGNLVRRTDALGNATTYEYDAARRLVAHTDPTGARTAWSHDALGALVSRTDPLGNVMRFEYEESLPGAPRLAATIFPDGARVERTYDASGRLASITDELGNRTSYEHDAAGSLVRVTDALGGVTQYRYDEAGNRISRIDANGNETRFEYDALGRMTRRILPLGMSERMRYDVAGNLIQKTDSGGNVLYYAYDAMGRLMFRTVSDLMLTTWTYTPTGRVRTVADPRGLTRYERDDRDRVTRIEEPDGAVLEYEYDAAGNRTALTCEGGTTRFAYDAAGRLIRVTDPEGGVSAYALDATGNVTSLLLPNGVETRRAYDARGRLAGIEHLAPGGAAKLAEFVLALDAAGNRVRETEAVRGRVVDHAYDAIHRLVSEKVGASTTAYAYDLAGNRLSAGGVLSTFDANNRILTVGGRTYAHDPRGNVTGVSEAGGTTSYAYDGLDRLVRHVDPAGVPTSYEYDAFGSCVGRSAGGAARRLIVDPLDPSGFPQVLAETDGEGALVARYVRGRGLLSLRRGGSTRYVLGDALGSTRLLAGTSGAVTDAYEYDGYGNLTARTGSTENPFLFAGERLDAASGLYDLRARWMDPRTGRFLSRDPFAGRPYRPQSLHGYSYAEGNPVNWTDPGGEETLGGISISISVGGILRTGVTVGRYFQTSWEVKEKIKRLLVEIPNAPLNEKLEAVALPVPEFSVGGGFGLSLGDDGEIGLGKLELEFGLDDVEKMFGEGAVGMAYGIAAEMAGDFGDVLAAAYVMPVGTWLLALPRQGRYVSRDFNGWAAMIYATQLHLEAADALSGDMHMGMQILGMYNLYLNYLVLMSATLPDVMGGVPFVSGGTDSVPSFR